MRFNFEALLMYTCIIKLPSLRYRNKFLKPQHHNNAPAKKKKKKKKKMRLANTAVWVSDESKSTPIYIYTIGSVRGSAVMFPTTRLVHVP